MKRSVFLRNLFLTFLFSVASLSAQEQNAQNGLRYLPPQGKAGESSLRAKEIFQGFGYADRYVGVMNPGYLGTGAVDIYLSAFIKIPDFGNNKITQISFPASKTDPDGQIVILSEDGSETLYAQNFIIREGNNVADLTTPFETEAGKRYLVGYATKAVGDYGTPDAFLIAVDHSASFADASLIGIGKTTFPISEDDKDFEFLDISEGSYGALCVFVTFEDETPIDNMGYLLEASGNFTLVGSGENVPTKVSLRNLGLSELRSFELSYHFGDNVPKLISHTLTTPLKVGETGEFTFDIPAEVDGMGQLHFSISKVNENPNKYADIEALVPYQIGDNDAIKRETVLIERFTCEKCGNCPPQDGNVQNIIKSYEDAGFRVSYIMHHAGFYTDFLTLPESSKLIPYFFNAETSYAPAISINRLYVEDEDAICYWPGSQNVTDKLFLAINDAKQGAKIEDVVPTINGDNLEVTVSGVALKGAFIPEDIFLTVILTESDIEAQEQAGAPAGEVYKHQAVPRKFLTDAFGQVLTPGEDGSFSVKLETKLDPSWVQENCKIVAIVHKSIKNENVKNRDVYTAETANLGGETSNKDLSLDEAPVVTASEGYLTISGSVDSFDVYDMSGVFVTNSINTRLLPGTYIVRIFKDFRTYTSKVLVL